MKVLAIRGMNIASLEGQFEIDFDKEPLRSAGLFAISGHTGAGKSTLLDVLCLALYDKSPRTKQKANKVVFEEHSKISQDDVRLILRRGTAAGWAEVDFKATNGDVYRCRWSVRRAYSKPTGALQASEYSVYNLSRQTELSGTKTDLLNQVEQLISLSYDQFTRSVLLAQNEFASFLKADDKEKADILEKLTGMEIYSNLSMMIYQKNKAAQDAVKWVNERLGNINVMEEAQLEHLSNQEKELYQTIGILEKEREKNYAMLNWLIEFERLNKRLDEATADCSLKLESVEQAAGRSEYLKRADANRETVSDYKKMIELENKINQKHSEREILIRQLEQIERVWLKESENLKVAEKNLLETRQLYDKQLPEIRRAREGDEKLMLAQNNETNEKKKYDDHYQNQEKAEKQLTQLRAELNDIEKQNRDIIQWQTTNSRHYKMVEDYSKIESQLNQLTLLERELESENVLMAKLKPKVSLLQVKLTALTNNEKEQKTKLESVVNNLNELRKKQDDIDKNQLNVELQALTQKKDLLQASQYQTREYLKSKESYENIESDLKRLNLLLEKTNTELLESDRKLDRANGELTQAEENFKFIQLASENNIVNLRSELKKNEPCPVCGSREHYLEAFANEVLVQSRQAYQNAKTNYDTLKNLSLQLQAQKSSFENQLDGLMKNREKQGQELKRRQEERHDLLMSLKKAGFDIDNIELTWTAAQLEDLGNKLLKLHEQEKYYSNLSKDIAEGQKVKDNLDHQLNDLISQLGNHKVELKDVETQLANSVEKNIKTEKAIDELIKDAGELITIDKWLEMHRKDSEGLRIKLLSFKNQWGDNEKKRQQLDGTYQKMDGQMKEQDQALTKLVHLGKDLSKLLELAQKQTQEAKGERASILNGRSADEVERELNTNVNQMQQRKEAQLQLLNDKKNELDTKKSENKLLDKDIVDKDAEMKRLNQKISMSCLAQSPALTVEELKNMVLLNDEWFLKERKQLNDLHTELEKAKTALLMMENSLKDHQKKENKPNLDSQNKELLIAQKEELEDKIKTLNEQRTGMLADLKRNEENKKQFTDVLVELEKKTQVANQWGQLNAILGSADGGAFKKIAQRYTLDGLLRYANKQLMLLSPRYELERIGESLALQVIDKDMCDERRPALSLSGGESFLVSLALALGLSSLASDKVSVESLFIDEGFGSLDIETLRTAMDALSNLQTQGRKIGVISHVQEMTESIAVRINVEKTKQGSSRIQITSY